jgi:hypothetical protein
MKSGGVVRKRVATVLVVLAGCAGGGGIGGEATASVGGDGSAETDGSGVSGDADDGGGSSRDGTEGEGTEFDPSAEEYTTNLREFGTYTATVEWSMGERTSDVNGSFEAVVRADVESESAYMLQTIPGDSNGTVTVELFWPESGDTVYTRYDTGGSVHYRSAPRNESMLTLWTEPGLGAGAVPSTGTSPGPGSFGGFRDTGVVSTDEGPRQRYVVDEGTADRLENASDGAVTEYYVEVLVDEERGIVTDYVARMTYNGTSASDPRSIEFELSYRDVGSTTVPTPGWLSEAEARTG